MIGFVATYLFIAIMVIFVLRACGWTKSHFGSYCLGILLWPLLVAAVIDSGDTLGPGKPVEAEANS